VQAVTLINTEDLVFIGPGSEWFWTAVSGIVLGGTFIAIYRQLRMQARMGAIEQLDAFRREAYSESMLRYALDIMVAQRDHDDPADIPEAAVVGLGDYWGSYATLARDGHRDARLLWRADSSSPQIIWTWVAPWVRKARAGSWFGVPTYEDLEWLAGTMAEMDAQAGRPAINEAVVANNRDQLIALHKDFIRYAESVRSAQA
jgi:hypothetical protein